MERLKSRADKILAICETIKLLNDDDVLELFMSTLPSSCAVQVNQSAAAVGRRTMDEIRRSSRAHSNSVSNLKFISLALSGKSVDFSKIISMIERLPQGKDVDSVAICAQKALSFSHDGV